MTVSAKQMEAILALPPAKRYSHFIKKVAGWGKMWGLYSNGWAMSETLGGAAVLPLWPEEEYARLCAAGDWSSYEPRAIELDEALDKMLPMLRERGIQPGIFFVIGQGSVNVGLDQFELDLRAELSKYA